MANLSRGRRRHVLNLIDRSGILTADVGDDALLMYVVGALCCNEVGVVKRPALLEALNDPSVVQAARTLLAKAAA